MSAFAACDHLYCLYQPGAAGFPARRRVAGDVWGTRRPHFLRRDCHDDYCRGDDCFQPLIRPADEEGWGGSYHSRQRVDDRRGAVWVFCFPFVLAAVPVGGSLWAGLGAGAVDAALNNYVALHFSSRHMNWLHCFWSVGAAASPYIMSYCLTGGFGWNNGYRSVAVVQTILTAALFLSLPLWKRRRLEGAEGESAAKALSLPRAVKIKGVPFVLIMFFGYCALEQAAGLWASSYLVQFRGVDPDTAAWSASLFYLGIAAGRFLCGFIAERLGDRRLIRIGILTMIAGVLLIALPVSYDVFTLAGLLIVGLGCAPVYPSVIHSTPANFGKENSQAIIGIQMASAYVGTTFMPPLFGLIAAHIHIGLYPAFLLTLAVLMLCMSEKLNRTVAKRQEEEARKETVEQEAENA